jgi:gamma-glutamyltranspeptidase/glutathione hydrolase
MVERSDQATTAVVAAGHPGTAAAMAEVLRIGGNAFDAAVAGGAAAAVAEPCLTSLAGGGFLAARWSDGRVEGHDGPTEAVVDFFVSAPGLGSPSGHDPSALVPAPVDFGGAVQDFHVGPASVAVPGVLAGYLHVLERWGRLDPAEVFAPAVTLAREGVLVEEPLARLLSLLEPILARTDTGRDLFFRHERPLRSGERLTNPALGQFLEDVAAGARSGFRADELGGGISEADLREYQVFEREPLVAPHLGGELFVNPAPSFGGRLVAAGLDLLAERPPFDPTDPQRVVELVEALVLMAELRDDLAGSTSGTTHLGVIDREGTAVSMTTSNGSGSGEFAPGLGVQLNNMMGEEDLHPRGFGSLPPGRRVSSMMAPGLLVTPGRTVAVGSGGSERIRAVILQMVLRLLDDGEPLAGAVEAPRLHWDGSVLQVEPGWPEDVLDVLASRWPVRRWVGQDLYFGGANLVSSVGEVAGDPRRGGVGLVL